MSVLSSRGEFQLGIRIFRLIETLTEATKFSVAVEPLTSGEDTNSCLKGGGHFDLVADGNT